MSHNAKSDDRVHVVAAVLRNEMQQILLSQRRQETHLAGYWEFPGGKVDGSEGPVDALERELSEELGIELISASPIISIPHDYPDKHILLDVYRIEEYQGKPRGVEGQQLKWVDQECLGDYKMPPPDIPVCTAILLPNIYVITPELNSHETEYISKLEQVLLQGIKLIQLRQPRLGFARKRQLAKISYRLCQQYGARLLLNGEPAVWERNICDGIHLNSRVLMSLKQRPLPSSALVAASCHSRDELQHASRLGLDFAVLSPVKKTRSHPYVEPIGWECFQQLAANATIPVYALGGMNSADLIHSIHHGSQGIAGISGFWPEN